MKKLHLFDNQDGTYDVQAWKDKEGYDYDLVGTFVFDKDQNAYVLWKDYYVDNRGDQHFDGDGVSYFESIKESFDYLEQELN